MARVARSKLGPVIVYDTREQRPLAFSPQAVLVRGTVPSGADYSVMGYETVIGIERKSLADLVGSLTVGRDRFLRSLSRLLLRRFRLLLVESPLSQLEAGYYRSQARPESMVGSVAKIVCMGIPVLFCADCRQAARFAERWLRIAWSCAREEDALGCAEWLESGPDSFCVEFHGRKRRRAA